MTIVHQKVCGMSTKDVPSVPSSAMYLRSTPCISHAQPPLHLTGAFGYYNTSLNEYNTVFSQGF